MTNASSLQALLQFAGLQPALFAPNSRYTGIDQAQLKTGGRTVAYLRRRFVPQPGRLSQVQQHTTRQGERLDHIAARYFGDPELFWRLCDANGALRPSELTAHSGRVLRITLAEGVPGARHA
jgi:hypothetical protein